MGYLLILLFKVIWEIIDRLIAPVIYFVAYLYRDKCRDYSKILWPGYLIQPTEGIYKKLWKYLDDSVYIEFGKEYANREKYYPKWLWKIAQFLFSLKVKLGGFYLITEDLPQFLLSWWWASVRNCTVNDGNYDAYTLGKFLNIKKHYGKSFQQLRKDKKGYALDIRVFENGERPYLEWYMFGKWNQLGWLNGDTKTHNGANRFEIDLFKKK